MPHAVDFFSGQSVDPVANHNHEAVESMTNHVSKLSVEDGTNWKHLIKNIQQKTATASTREKNRYGQ